MRAAIDSVPDHVHAARLGVECNPHITFRVIREAAALYFEVSDFGGAPHSRVTDTMHYLRELHGIGSRVDGRMSADAPPFIFQCDDNPHHFPSVSWESKFGWHGIRLVPDLYYYHYRGYEDFRPEQVAWADREDKVFWRGSSTGLFQFGLDNIGEMPRYRLARIAKEIGAHADIGFTQVVQARAEDEAAVTQHLHDEGLFKAFVPMPEMTRYRYFVDIDGNANSWNMMQKLRLGACMLKVDSQYQQWFHDRLNPWEHYVPVAEDLSDFAARVEWCRSNAQEASNIALRGRRFATNMTFADEMLRAARAIYL